MSNERRDGMEKLITEVALLNQALTTHIEDDKTFKDKTFAPMNEKVTWTYGQLKGNGKTTLEAFREEDRLTRTEVKEVKDQLTAVQIGLIEELTELRDHITNIIKPVSDMAQRNKNNIWKIFAGIGLLVAMIGGAIVWIPHSVNAALAARQATEMIIQEVER